MRVALFGPPGAGKGTQAKILAERLAVPHISTGDMFRQAINEQTSVGMKAKGYIGSGELVPDEITNSIVRERLSQADCVKGGFLIDGFPRTVAQARVLEIFLDELGEPLDGVVFIDVEMDLLVQRLSGRRVCRKCDALYHLDFNPPKFDGVCDRCAGALYQRDDDKEMTVRRRLDVYHMQTRPVIDIYREKKLLIDIDGNHDTDHVSNAIIAALER